MKLSHCLALAVALLLLFSLTILGGCKTEKQEISDKAAIIDQLCLLELNQAFICEISKELDDLGFEVDVYRGDAITVDLFRKLPTYGYKLIIFRVHSGLLGVDPKVTNRTWLFTAEPYSKTSHVTEQLTDRVTYAKTHDDDPWIFAISAKFITQSMKGQFNNTAIIMMGCDCFHFEDLAQAFIQKGASTYVAWDVSVVLGYVDDATTTLIEKLCSEKLTLRAAVTETMKEKGPDPKYGAVLKYYPPASADKTLKQLINGI